MLDVQITLWPKLTDTDTHIPWSGPWADLVLRWSVHRPLANKMDGMLFGPYALVDPSSPCTKHAGRPRAKRHKCNSAVEAVSLLVFDADEGTAEQIDACRKRLTDAGIEHIWYSSYSWSSSKPAYRLVVPPSHSIPHHMFARVRREFIDTYAVPADPSKSSGLCHSYFEPSSPDGRGVFVHVPGTVWTAPAVTPAPVVPSVVTDYEPPDDPTEPVDLAPLVDRLRKRARKLAGSSPEKAALLRACLEGKPLAGPGARNNSAFRVAGMIAAVLTEQPVGVIEAIMRPSVDAMINAGSSLTHDDVRRFIYTGLKNQAERRAQIEVFSQQYWKAMGLRPPGQRDHT